MREEEQGQNLNYKYMGERLTQIKFKQIAYVMHEMKETKGCLKEKSGSRRPRLPASFHV